MSASSNWTQNSVSDVLLVVEILLSTVITAVTGYYAKKTIQEKLDRYAKTAKASGQHKKFKNDLEGDAPLTVEGAP